MYSTSCVAVAAPVNSSLLSISSVTEYVFGTALAIITKSPVTVIFPSEIVILPFVELYV